MDDIFACPDCGEATAEVSAELGGDTVQYCGCCDKEFFRRDLEPYMKTCGGDLSCKEDVIINESKIPPQVQGLLTISKMKDIMEHGERVG